jgi:acyl dehydratase
MNGSPQIYFEELSCGDPLPEREYGPVGITDTVRWAGLQENWSQLHFDRDHVREHNGSQTFIASGAYREALLFRMLTDWAGPRGRLCKISVRHRYSTFEGDRIFYRGNIVEKSATAEDPWVRCDVEGTNQQGRQILTGTCLLLFPAKDAGPAKERT